MNNLKQLILALHNYHDVYGCFPPACVADAQGRPMHSWRVLVLPYLDEKKLYNQYNFNEPWNGPNNSKLAAKLPPWLPYCCPSDSGGGNTSYLAVVGSGAAWPGQKPRRIEDFEDGTHETILLVEVVDSGIHWMEPRDLSFDEACRGINPASGLGISSRHPEDHGAIYISRPIANVAMADGSVSFVPQDLPAETLKALLTSSGRDGPVHLRQFLTARLNWPWIVGKIVGALIFAASTLLLLQLCWQSGKPAMTNDE